MTDDELADYGSALLLGAEIVKCRSAEFGWKFHPTLRPNAHYNVGWRNPASAARAFLFEQRTKTEAKGPLVGGSVNETIKP